ncbi:MAG TPA: DUF488 domain-containing protein [Candidatus Limnocylindria bacterium]|nr:DUF488 domain-containing protein [Candidatus Limnocylindria bacterium]
MWTIGHGTRSTEELATLLRDAGVDTLIDVRRYPAGRRQPHLSREALAESLPAQGLRYEWQGEPLGGRRTATPGAEERTGWRNPAFAAYAEHLKTPVARHALERLEARAHAGERLALMCSETVWWRCHRRLIADAVVCDGLEVVHLLDRAPGRPHRSRG